MSTCKRPDLLDAVRTRLRAGDSWLEAAAALGISKGAVSGLMRRHGMGDGTPPPKPPKPPRHTPAEGRPILEAIRAGLRRGLTLPEACRAAGTTDDVGRGLIRRHGQGDGLSPQNQPVRKPAPLASEPVLEGSPKPGCCQWPLNDGKPEWLFCDHPRQPGRPYCSEHHRRAFIRVRESSGAPFILFPVRAA